MKTAAQFCSIVALLAGCAGQRPPEGGPPDTTPPEIISVYPQPNTVNFSDNKIVLEFSEYVDRRSTEEAIFISPAIDDIEFDWSGTEAELTFNEPLRKNTTYVFTVGTDVVDYRNRNKMAKAVTLAFSTGDKIDNGAITGRIFDDAAQGVMIFSYRKDDIDIDTLNPMTSKPDYITQAGDDGSFALTNLSYGSYRLYAVNDEYRNLLYDPETDAAGTTGDVRITEKDTIASGITFIIAKEDTTAPRISSVTADDVRHVVVQFSEAMDSSTVSPSRFFISDTNGREAISIEQIFPNTVPVNSYTLITSPQARDSVYILTADSVRDKAGFVINRLARQKQFKGSGDNDTIPPSLVSHTIAAAGGKILPDQTIDFRYSDPITILQPDSLIDLRKKRDSSIVPFTLVKKPPVSVSVTPVQHLQIGERYVLLTRYRFMSDPFGNSFADSAATIEFTADDPELYGSIEGSVAGFGGTGTTVVQAKNLSDRNQATVHTVVTSRGQFSFPLLPEGQYSLKAFDDKNDNRVHDAGRVFPHVPAEKFILGKDTVRVRPRWPVDGVLIKK